MDPVKKKVTTINVKKKVTKISVKKEGYRNVCEKKVTKMYLQHALAPK